MMEKKCQFCDLVFHKNEHLDRHERTHTKERPFVCSVCSKRFVRNDTLKRHERLHNRDEASPRKRQASGLGLGSLLAADAQAAQIQQVVAPLQVPSRQTGEVLEASGVDNFGVYGLNPIMATNQLSGALIPGEEPWPEFKRLIEFEVPIAFDFDIRAMNQFLASGDFETLTKQESEPSEPDMVLDPPIATPSYPTPSDAVKYSWFNNIDEHYLEAEIKMQRALSRSNPPLDSLFDRSDSGDESFRAKVNRKLVAKPFGVIDTLPSVEFLNTCFELYFKKFHPLFPITHRPTYQVNGLNQFHITAMSMIGAQFVGTSAARDQASKMFRQLNKVVLATWENARARGRHEDLVVTRTAIVGQIFAFLSGNPVYMAICFAFHGTVIAWARQTGMFTESMQQEFLPQFDMSPEDLDKLWRDWSTAEQTKRAALGLHIQDAELASLYHAPPILRHTGNRHFYACENEVFTAPDAESWAKAILAHPPSQYTFREWFMDRTQNWAQEGMSADRRDPIPDPQDEFTLYIMLVGIQAQVCEACELGTLFMPMTQEEILRLLLAWYKSYSQYCALHQVLPSSSPFCLMILWHSIFVSLFSNIHDLEIAFGSSGAKEALHKSGDAVKWAISIDANRAAAHVIRIRRLLSSLPISTIPAIHIPRIAFQSAIVLWCYFRFRDGSVAHLEVDSAEWHSVAMWKEFADVGLDARELLRELGRVRSGFGAEQPLSAFSEILQRLGYWGLSKKLGDILNVAIHEETDVSGV